MRPFAKWNAIIRARYHIDPDTLDNESWAKMIAEIEYVEGRERRLFKEDLSKVLYELASALYGRKK